MILIVVYVDTGILLLLFPFHRGENCGLERLSKLFKVTQVTQLVRFEPDLNLGSPAPEAAHSTTLLY